MAIPSSIKTLSIDNESRIKVPDFDAIRVTLASPEEILSWSYGEVTRSETINYRTQKPEMDGLFCQRIFGPVKDWQCACGKYKKIRYKGIICDKCGVEVTRSIVRRERMGHIKLAAPVAHIWFLRSTPSRIGLILGLPGAAVERVVYFTSFIITKVNEELKKEIFQKLEEELKIKKKELKEKYKKIKADFLKNLPNQQISEEEKNKKIEEINRKYKEELTELKHVYNLNVHELNELKPLKVISEQEYEELSLKYGYIFEAGIGAEAIQQLLKKINLKKLIQELKEKVQKIRSRKRRQEEEKRIIQRLRLAEALERNNIRPEWMILEVIPVIPPDLRPMVQLDGGRFASSDLNDLYRRVINRNNRLKRLIELKAPEVICRNEKRMLQEAVDALIDNSARKTKTVTTSGAGKRTLKSLADILKGKQGRFRQNLLGKRVDYSGRSVIAVGPHLKLWQCGLPKIMAIELFKPFVIGQLIKKGYVFNVRAASKMIDEGKKEVWDILEEVIKNYYVLLNRAPTLHRLSIQAFQPVLIEGKAILIHPFVCPPFNADFDGDQMAVHVPISEQAQKEAKEIMLSSKNLLKPATGEPITTPTHDMVWGCYYMTLIKEPKDKEKIKIFGSPKEVILAYQEGKVGLNEKIKVRIKDKLIETGVGRVIFNSILPENIRCYDQVIDKSKLKKIISHSLEIYGLKKTGELLDKIKEISLEFITSLGPSWGMDDLPLLKEKSELIKNAEKEVEKVEEQYKKGLLSKEERHMKIIRIWIQVKEQIAELGKRYLNKWGSVYTMVDSHSRGSWSQITQMMGMKGLVINPLGETIELPVKSSFREGFDVLEYFISTHGARKGLTDTALRTANAGYLTRRLVDVAHSVIVTEEDCGDTEGLVVTQEESEEMGKNLAERVMGRVSLEKIVDPKTKKVIVDKNQIITPQIARRLKEINLKKIRIRSVLTCKTRRGVCQKCYGYDLGYNRLVDLGAAVGIVAAQSIGEPGTQLTLRTFHTGGVLGRDITQGLPRVEELFEARPVKREALISEVAGQVKIVNEENQRKIKILFDKSKKDSYKIEKGDVLKVKDGQKVKSGEVLLVKKKGEKILAKNAGEIKIENNRLYLNYLSKEEKEYLVPFNYNVLVKDGDLVKPGDRLTDGPLNLHKLFRFKGKEATQRYIIKEIQHIYSSEGQKLDDKHIEIIVRQMFSSVLVKDAGDSDLLTGEIVSKAYFQDVCDEVKKKGGKLPEAKEIILGITRASLSTESFLSAASFQETSRVLINAALTGRIDKLTGLKENVIIGRLIPAGTGFVKRKEDKK